MGVIMQAFYWDCPRVEAKEYRWWNFVKERIPSLKSAGFTALWLPPACKAANLSGASMGYDPYDFYDLGNINQKGTTKTWFGSKDELLGLIAAAHASGMDVYADLVINHNSGGDAQEANPIDQQQRWTKFTPGSGKFLRNYIHFHPSPYESWDQMTFGDMPDLCHRNPYVYTQIIEYATWLLEEVGFDGFRYDCVKGYGGWMVRAIQELCAIRNGMPIRPFGVGECWDSDRKIGDWLDETNAWSDNRARAFDFPLRDRLKKLCDVYGFSLRNLVSSGTLMNDRPTEAVTFVENHDVARDKPIINDKMLAYAFILTHEGYPCVFWHDYYNLNLGLEGGQSGIAALARAHKDHAGGAASVLYVDDDFYVMQRNGNGEQKGLLFVLNNRGDAWRGEWVKTQWNNTRLVPVAWRGQNDAGMPREQNTQANG